jgi:hypothetical protein
MKKTIRWILCLPVAVAAFAVIRVIYFLIFYIILSIPKISPIKFELASSDEFLSVMSSHDMQGHYVNGTWWVFLLGFTSSLTAVMAAMLCAPSHRKTVAITVASLGAAVLVGTAVFVALSPSVDQTFSFWYRSVVELVASLVGFGVAVFQAIKIEKEVND